MRPAVAIALATSFIALPCSAITRSTLTVLLEFEQSATQSTFNEIQKELGRLLEPAGLQIDVRMRADVQPGESFDDLVIVTLKGSCEALEPILLDERGPAPLAFAHTVGSTVLPFTVVACDRVRRTVDGALWGGQRKEREQLFGRAVGRVLAHELYHVLEKTTVHSRSGIFRKSLTGSELIADSLDFAPADIQRLRRSVERTARPVPIVPDSGDERAGTAPVLHP